MGVGCQQHAPADLPPGKTRYPLYYIILYIRKILYIILYIHKLDNHKSLYHYNKY